MNKIIGFQSLPNKPYLHWQDDSGIKTTHFCTSLSPVNIEKIESYKIYTCSANCNKII